MSAPLSFDAWHLPGVEVGDLATLDVGELACRYPSPTTGLVDQAAAVLRDAGRSLTERPVDHVVDVIDAAAARLTDAGDPLRLEAEALITAATGYSTAMTRVVLDGMAADWRGHPLRALLAAELTDPGVLDGFRPVAPVTDDRLARAYGPSLAFQVFAGSVPGVAVTALVRALLVKAPSLGKLAAGQPVLPVLFARAVASVDPDMGRALALTYWPGGSRHPEARALDAADTVVVYGGEEAVASYRERVAPHHRLVVHGPRFSAGLVARDALDADLDGTARDVARSVAVFDQHGCVSPHAVWVEEGQGASALDFARALADALERLEAELPRGRVSPAEASAIHQERAAAELKGLAPDGTGTRVLTGDGTRWTVIFDPEPAFRASCLNRLVRVHPVTDLQHAVEALTPVASLLQSVAIAGADHRRATLADRLARIGAARITTFPRLPWPPAHWHHDGRQPLRELIRWVDLET